CYTRHLISKIARTVAIRQHKYRKNVRPSKVIQQQIDADCSCTTEAIIQAHREPDIPFDLLQKRTIEEMRKKDSQQKSGQYVIKTS
ncbi:unnamed protein product, partial [Rotaria sp. Silwood2]